MPTEEALEKELIICDPHHHLYPADSPVHTPYLVEDLRRDTGGGHRVVSTVHLQPVGETEWVVSLAGDDGFMSRIIGYADLMRGAAAEEILDAHVAAGKG